MNQVIYKSAVSQMSVEYARQLDYKSSLCVSRKFPSHDEGDASSKNTTYEVDLRWTWTLGLAQSTLEKCDHRSRADRISVKEGHGKIWKIRGDYLKWKENEEVMEEIWTRDQKSWWQQCGEGKGCVSEEDWGTCGSSWLMRNARGWKQLWTVSSFLTWKAG